jgi:ABC-2 type transport system ATP-binding protein
VDTPVIDVASLTKTFDQTAAVDRISFRVYRGELLGFLGPNGAGKTTTIAMLLGLVAPTTGTVRILGEPMPQRRHAILSRVNFSSPYVALPYDLTVRENLTVFGHLYSIAGARNRIAELTELFGVAHLLDRRTGALSSGETARVNLVKAFLNNPDVLFLDEPTAALDPEAADTVRSLLLRLGRDRGLTIFYTSHNMREVERLSSRIIFLHHGRIIADGPAAEIVREYGKADLEEFFVALARSEQEAPA